MILLALDPSINRTGWAMFVGDNPPRYGSFHGGPDKGLDARMMGQMGQQPDAFHMSVVNMVVIESPVGATSAERAPRTRLPVYGFSVGAWWYYMVAKVREQSVPGDVELIGKNEWTNTYKYDGRTLSKQARHDILARVHYPNLDPVPNSDEWDAIGLGRWWLERQNEPGA